MSVVFDSAVPRILLFGHPGSGKSSLLGALLQAGATQPDVLGCTIIDPTRRLNRIHDHVYDGADFHNTRTELVAYTLELPPWDDSPASAHLPNKVELLDCDGTAATALLKHPDPITDPDVRGTVASAVVRADLLALVVNAGATDAELDAAFDEFLMFLDRVQGRRTFGREVGGFPIALILAQCDRLADPGDTREEWEARVRGNLKYAQNRFSEFLTEKHSPIENGTDAGFLPFGSVDLKGYAVAVRWPRLVDDPHASDEPYEVAELFHDLFTAAEVQAERVRRSGRRLRATVWAAVLAVGGLIAGAVAVDVLQPPPADPGLAQRVRAFEELDTPAAVRLAEKNLTRNKRVLTGFRSDPGFFALPEDLREFVTGHLQEIDNYQAYRAKLDAAPAPIEARTLEELAQIEGTLTTELALPPEYTWGETEAAQLRDKWLADVPLIRTAVHDWQEWYRGLANQALALTTTRSFDGPWRKRVGDLDAEAIRTPFNPADPLPDSQALPQPRGEAVTYRVPFEFDGVYQARHDWEFTHRRLLDLRDLADALALTSKPDNPARRVFDLPPPGPDVNAVSLPGERLESLRREFPSALEPYPDWNLARFPEPGRAILTNRVRESFWNGVRITRGLILEALGKLPPGGDTPRDWRRVADSLDTPAFRDWGRLLHVLARLENPQATDAVRMLEGFLRVDSFALDAKGFDLSVPLALRVPALVPAGPLTITATPAGEGSPRVRSFKLSGEGTTRELVTRYHFVPESADPLVYRPGDGMKAELPVRSGEQRFTLLWDTSTTRSYQFDCLNHEPQLTRDKLTPEPATGVTLSPSAGSKVPRLPVLLPDLR